jgi:Ca-activated chloride channel family protein
MTQHIQSEDEIQFEIALATPILLARKKRQTVYLRIGLTGFHLDTQTEPLVPLNVALVLDKSSSMQGIKMFQAKKAAMTAVTRLRPTDMIAIVTYAHQGNVLLPSTQAKDLEMINSIIQTIRGNGQTALFDGLEKGAKEIRKSWQRHQINRIILVSDGIANVGPNSPSEVGEFGRILGEENIAVTTIGLGLDYGEDLMMQLSQQSDGNHAFVENVTDITRVFEQEFTDMASIVAQEVNVSLICTENVFPVKVLGREAKIEGQMLLVKLNQLYSEQEKYILVELEVSPVPNQREQTIAGVAVVYRNLKTHRSERLSDKITVTFTHSKQQVAENTNTMVMTAVAEQLAVEKNKLALQARDLGQIQEAKQLLLENANFLAEEAAKYGADSLEKLKTLNLEDANHLEEDYWVRQRKSMRQEQFRFKNQQKY